MFGSTEADAPCGAKDVATAPAYTGSNISSSRAFSSAVSDHRSSVLPNAAEIRAERLERPGTSEGRDQAAQTVALGCARVTHDVARDLPLGFRGALVVFPRMRIHVEEPGGGHGGLCQRKINR